MSSPPGSTLYGVQPVDTPFSGTTDANGGFTQKVIPRSAYWTVLKLVGMATGNPTWTLYKSGATIPIDFGLGPNVSMGPFLLAPQQDITLVIKNALPKLPVTGTITGLQAPDLSSVVGHFQPQSSFVTVGAQGALPTDFNPVRFTTAAVLSGATVIPVADTSIFAPDQAVDVNPGGTHLVASVQIGVSITLQTGVTANIPAGSPVMRVGVVGIFGQPIAVTFNPANPGTNKVTPAAFQQAQFAADVNQNPLAGGATVTLVTGIVGQTIYIWSVHLGISAVTSNVVLQDTLGNFYWRSTFNNTTSPAGINSEFDTNCFGVQVPNDGRSLQLLNGDAGAHGIFGTVYYSQG